MNALMSRSRSIDDDEERCLRWRRVRSGANQPIIFGWWLYQWWGWFINRCGSLALDSIGSWLTVDSSIECEGQGWISRPQNRPAPVFSNQTKIKGSREPVSSYLITPKEEASWAWAEERDSTEEDTSQKWRRSLSKLRQYGERRIAITHKKSQDQHDAFKINTYCYNSNFRPKIESKSLQNNLWSTRSFIAASRASRTSNIIYMTLRCFDCCNFSFYRLRLGSMLSYHGPVICSLLV